MEIKKYKYLKNGKYEVLIDNEKYILYEDIILKNNILIEKEIDKKKLDNLLKDNSFYEAYYKAINYINKKLRTRKEINNYLRKNDFDNKVVKDAIKRLEFDGYLNDDLYSKAYIHDEMILKSIGPNKIKDDLVKKGIKEEIVIKNLKVYTKEIEFEKLNKLIPKLIKNNKNKSSYILKNKILNDMFLKGFTKEYIMDVIDMQDFDDSDIYKKEYDKLYKKLSSKYSGSTLEYKIKEKLYNKGFRQN